MPSNKEQILAELRAEVAADKAAANARQRESKRILWSNSTEEYKEMRREKNRKWHSEHHRHTPERAAKDRERRRSYKQAAVTHFGGKCNRCNESYHPAVFEFHHLNPADKDPNFAAMIAAPIDKLIGLLADCEMLCANCHRITHAELRGYEWDVTQTQ